MARAGKRGCAVLLASALAATPVAAAPAFAETAQAPAPQQPDTAGTVTAKDATTAEATAQADLDDATEGSTVELRGAITESLRVDRKLTLTAKWVKDAANGNNGSNGSGNGNSSLPATGDAGAVHPDNRMVDVLGPRLRPFPDAHVRPGRPLYGGDLHVLIP